MSVKIIEMTATQVRANFGAALKLAHEYGAIQVTRRGQPAAYLLSPATFISLRGIDNLVARMQDPASIKVAKSLMTIDTRKLRKALSGETDI